MVMSVMCLAQRFTMQLYYDYMNLFQGGSLLSPYAFSYMIPELYFTSRATDAISKLGYVSTRKDVSCTAILTSSTLLYHLNIGYKTK